MIDAQNMKHVMMLEPQTIATTATATGTVDTLGYEHLQVFIAGDTASSAMSVLKLSEGTNTSAATDIAAFTGGDTTDGFTIASADTSNGVSSIMDVDLSKRERYIKVSVTPGASQVCGVTAILSRPKDAPVTAAEHGVDVFQTG